MFRNYIFAICVFSLLVMGQPAKARAADACQPVFDALQKVITTPSHSYTSGIHNGEKPTEAETIFAGGQKYIRAHGKWMSLGVISQDVLEQEKENEKNGKSSCQLVRSESVNGESASLYHMQRDTENFKEDSQIWISKATGLPLREEQDIDYGGKIGKWHNSARFEYGNVRAPI